MATSYPTGLDTFTAIGATDEMNDEVGTRTHSEMHNDANDAIEAIEAELGTSPSGSYDTVAARLAASDPSALLVKANNLSDLASASTARTNLGLGTMATATATDYLTKAGNLTGLADLPTARTNLGLGTMATATASDYLSKAGNLGGIADPAAARTNLSLGDSATRDVGTTAGTVAAGDDSRITGALQASGNLSGIADAAVARANLDVGELFTPAVGTSFNIIPPLGWSHTQALDGADSIRLWPVEVPEAMTISAMSIYIRSAASAGVWRMGWYLLDGANGLPTTLIAEAGTIIPTSTGEKAITGLSINLPRGWIAFGMAQQSSPSGGAWLVGLPQQNGLRAVTGAHQNCYNAIAAGAFPSTIAAAPVGGVAPPAVKITRSA